MIKIKETRSIKFYLDKSVNKSKKEELIKFLKECADVENQLYEYFWEHYDIVLNSSNKINFNYSAIKLFNYRSFTPVLKSHHYQQVIQDVYGNLIGMRNKIKNQMKFYCEDEQLGKVYKYCRYFCFEWDYLEKHIAKQIKKYKKSDNIIHYRFLLSIQNMINDKDKYNKLKETIGTKFWEYKNKNECPIMKSPTIWCNTAHTIELKQNSYYNWYFILDSNERIGGSDRKGVYKEMVIPIKYSDYHYKTLEGNKLNKSFKIRLNQNNRIEIMATYEINKEYPEIKDPTNIVGIDIGLKKLVFCSDGEIIDQNPDIIKYAKYINKRKSNLWNLGNHLKNKLGEDYIPPSNKRLTRQYSKLTHMVNCDNRYKIKQFLKGRENDLIVMEDLNIQDAHLHKEVNMLLRSLHIQEIKNDVLRYCKEYGINVQLVNPAYTSQQCPICGHTSKDNRKTQEMFCCVKCNHTDNADHNASINIMNRIHMPEIKLNTPVQEIKELIALHYTASD